MTDTQEPGEAGAFRTVPFVARRLGWTERTIRRRLVPTWEWRREMLRTQRSIVQHTHESGQIPAMLLGRTWKIPAWWLVAILREGEAPVSE